MGIKDKIIAANDLKTKTVDVPEWGVKVVIRTMTGAEKSNFEVSTIAEDGKVDRKDFRAKMLSQCLVDEEGKRIFADEDLDILGTKSAAVIERLWGIASKLNAYSKKDVDELTKN